MEKAPELAVAFSSCVDLAVILPMFRLVPFGMTLRQAQDKLSLRNNIRSGTARPHDPNELNMNTKTQTLVCNTAGGEAREHQATASFSCVL